MCICCSERTTSPVSGCSVAIASISSPKNSIRIASSSYTGMISTVSPRTRNVPRVNAMSLRVYCMVDELAQQLVAVDLVAHRRARTIRSTYSCGVPRP